MAGKLHELIAAEPNVAAAHNVVAEETLKGIFAAVIFIIMAAGIGALTTIWLQPKPITTIINEQFDAPYIDEEFLRMRWRDI